MLVTKITPVDKKRFNVFIDNKLAFVLYKGELRQYRVSEDEEISEPSYNSIMDEVLPKRAFNRCSHLLEKRDYTSHELRKKLLEGKYPDTVIDRTIAKLTDYGFINDLSYATRYIECYISRKSVNAIKQSLYVKGIKSDIFDAAYNKTKAEGIVQNEEELIKKLLVKRHFYDKDVDAKEYAKQYNYLASKGFSGSAIRKVLKEKYVETY